MGFSQELRVLAVSSAAPLMLYAINHTSALQQPSAVLEFVGAVLLAVVLLTHLSVRNEKRVDPLFYVFAVFSFTSVVDLTSALELDGYIRGFVESYISKGEPYLNTAHCIVKNYWNGVVHFVLLLTVIHRMWNGKPFRSAALLWAGSMIASQIVFIPSIIIGKHVQNIYPAFWLHVVFLILTVWAAVTLFSRPTEPFISSADKVLSEQSKGLLSRPKDLLLTVAVVGAMVFTTFRGFVVLECTLDLCFNYIYQYEPYMKDSVAFPKVMMLVFLFYALPLLTVFVYGLNTAGCTWMLDWSVFLAGAVAQIQSTYIGASVHPRTPFTYRIPEEEWNLVMSLNLLYLAVPLLVALRCYGDPTFFMTPVPPGQTDSEKKTN